MATSITGIVRGKIIELDQAPGLPDGQAVAVTLQPLSPGASPALQQTTPELPKWEGKVIGKLTRDEIYDDRP
jgi:hypothetical protein